MSRLNIALIAIILFLAIALTLSIGPREGPVLTETIIQPSPPETVTETVTVTKQLPPKTVTETVTVTQALAPKGRLEANVTVYFIDVGQGDSIFIDTAGKDVLVDGGRRGAGRLVLGLLERLGVREIEYIVASHPDADHIGGLIEVMASFDEMGYAINGVIDNGQRKATSTYREYIELAEMRPMIIAERGMSLKLDSRTTMTILNPTQPLEFEDFNENSIVLRIEVEQVSFLLTGDLEREGEASLLLSGLSLSSTILKVGHHGSRSSTSVEFLEAVSPELAVISVGSNNPYGHPHPEVINRLLGQGIRVMRTDIHGTISITTNGIDYSIRIEKGSLAFKASLVINEVELNPPSRDDGKEWVELFNPTSSRVSLTGWSIMATHGKPCSRDLGEAFIEPMGFLLVMLEGGQCLDNEDEVIVLMDSSGLEVDRTPPLSDKDNDDRTWQRAMDGLDSDSREDWEFREGSPNGPNA